MSTLLLFAVFVAAYINPLVAAPIASFYFEAAAFVAWGLLLAVASVKLEFERIGVWGRLVLATFGLPAVSITVHSLSGHSTVWQLTLIGVYFHIAAVTVAWAGWNCARTDVPDRGAGLRKRTGTLLGALIVAATFNALVAWVQYLLPGRAFWFAADLIDQGRAFGNLRQPNQFALFEVWGLLALLASHANLWQPFGNPDQAGPREATIQKRRLLSPSLMTGLKILLLVLITMSVAMSGSRTGAVLVWMLAGAFGLLPGLPKSTRLLAVSLALLHLLTWWLLQALDQHNVLPFFSVERGLSTTASLSDSRLLLWSDVLVLIREHPVVGVGYGMLNHALNDRSLLGLPATNNAHNLFLQLAVEHGMPFAILWAGLLSALLLRIALAWRLVAVRFLFAGVLAVVFHSQLEYPLWYAHLLLPVAYVLGTLSYMVSNEGVAKADTLKKGHASGTPVQRAVVLAAFVALPGWAVMDYWKVSPIYEPSEAPVLARIVRAYESHLFTYLADFASFTAIPVTLESAPTHYSLGLRVSRFDANELVAFQQMMAAGYTNRWAEAAMVHARLLEFFPEKLKMRTQNLTPEGQLVFDKILEQAAVQP